MKHTHDLDRVVDCVVRSGRATPAVLQRELGVDAGEARQMLRKLEWLGVVARTGRRLTLLLTPEEWAEVLAASTHEKSAIRVGA